MGTQVCPSEGVIITKFKNRLLQNHFANFNQAWQKQKVFWMKGIHVCIKKNHPFPRGDNYEIGKTFDIDKIDTILKNF